jgi:enoyl-CoA hydratase/carnithine racemase
MVQQAYRALRILAEAQTVRMLLLPELSELLLNELAIACTALTKESSAGLKCVILDFGTGAEASSLEVQRRQPWAGRAGRVDERLADEQALRNHAGRVAAVVRAVPQPVLALVRETLSEVASLLLLGADLTLVAEEASLCLALHGPTNGRERLERLPARQALLLGQVTWCVPAASIDERLEEVLRLLRRSSAVALRNAKAAVRLAQRLLAAAAPTPASFPLPELLRPENEGERDELAERRRVGQARLEALKRVNAFYLTEVMRTEDAHEGLRAFLEKRPPRWQIDQEQDKI